HTQSTSLTQPIAGGVVRADPARPRYLRCRLHADQRAAQPLTRALTEPTCVSPLFAFKLHSINLLTFNDFKRNAMQKHCPSFWDHPSSVGVPPIRRYLPPLRRILLRVILQIYHYIPAEFLYTGSRKMFQLKRFSSSLPFTFPL